jgi:hypothetical protein
MLDGRCWRISSIWAYFRRFSCFWLTLLLMSDFGNFGICRKLTTSNLQWHRFYGDLSSSHETAVFGIRAAEVISLLAIRFLLKILNNSEMLLMNQENQLLGNLA